MTLKNDAYVQVQVHFNLRIDMSGCLRIYKQQGNFWSNKHFPKIKIQTKIQYIFINSAHTEKFLL